MEHGVLERLRLLRLHRLHSGFHSVRRLVRAHRGHSGAHRGSVGFLAHTALALVSLARIPFRFQSITI